MGLPLWREPEKKSSKREATAKTVPSVSSLCDTVRAGGVDRRRAYSNRHPSARREFRRPRLDFIASQLAADNTNVTGFNDAAQQATAPVYNAVPSVSNLFEVANRQENARLERMDAERAEREAVAANLLVQSSRLRAPYDWRVPGSGDPANWRTPGEVVEDRMRLVQETTRAISDARHLVAQSTVPVPPAFSPPSPDTSSRRLRRARALTNSDDHSVRLLPTPVDGPSVVDGLGDRNRSPTPPEAWEVMRSTIQPDTTLPSQESSFTTAMASQAFARSQDYAASLPSTAVTDDADTVSSPEEEEQARNEESASSLEDEEAVCDEDTAHDATEALARDMYYREMETPEGRERIAEQQALRAREGNRFAMANEAASVDIGFRLIEAALEQVEERHRTLRLRGRHRSAAEYGPELARLSDIIEDDRARQLDGAEASQDAPAAYPVGSHTVDPGLATFQANITQSVLANFPSPLASEGLPDEWLTSMGLARLRERARRNQASSGQESRGQAGLDRVAGGRIGRQSQGRQS